MPLGQIRGVKSLRSNMSKYGAKPTTIDGIRFASKKEGRRYRELKVLLKAGRIAELRLQVPYRIEVNGMLICTYKADFVYTEFDVATGGRLEVIEDCKGVRTPVYKLKAKLMRAIHGIEIQET